MCRLFFSTNSGKKPCGTKESEQYLWHCLITCANPSFERFPWCERLLQIHLHDTYIYISEISLNLYNYVNSREAIHRVICRLIIIIIVVVVVYRLSIRLLNSSLRMSSFATRIIHTSKTLWQNRAKFSLRWFRITRLHVVPFNNKFRFGKIFFVMSWLSRPNFISIYTNHLIDNSIFSRVVIQY